MASDEHIVWDKWVILSSNVAIAFSYKVIIQGRFAAKSFNEPWFIKLIIIIVDSQAW